MTSQWTPPWPQRGESDKKGEEREKVPFVLWVLQSGSGFFSGRLSKVSTPPRRPSSFPAPSSGPPSAPSQVESEECVVTVRDCGRTLREHGCGSKPPVSERSDQTGPGDSGGPSARARVNMPEVISVPEFVAETNEDYQAPTTSSFSTRMSHCRNTVAALEEVRPHAHAHDRYR